jgi:hypothetical protein
MRGGVCFFLVEIRSEIIQVRGSSTEAESPMELCEARGDE